MTQIIPLQAEPNQTISVTFDEDRYEITLKAVNNNLMALDMIRNNITLFQGLRIVAGTPLIPYRYLESGNFILLTLDNCQPYYTRFGVDQALVFASAEELVAFRG